jgi:uncharacterized SAM-binding protein YcdF (DUF218 family)
MEVILHLGGSPERAITAARLAAAHPESKVVVSTEGQGFAGYYEAAGIAPERIIVDEAAWDTVTNFTHTYELLKNLGCSRLFVVTDLFHCYRSSLIALACWGGRVPFYMVPHGDSIRESDEAIAWADFARTLCWRLTGVLFFWKSRNPGDKLGQGHAKLEIGL